jgi:hypothetical protein
MNTYQMLGERVGTPEARDLAVQLRAWHDAMVTHLRLLKRGGGGCHDECPHADARTLWPMALDVMGPLAASLEFLRVHGGGVPGRTMEGRAARIGS